MLRGVFSKLCDGDFCRVKNINLFLHIFKCTFTTLSIWIMTALWYWSLWSRTIILFPAISCEPQTPPEQVLRCTHLPGLVAGCVAGLLVSRQCFCYEGHSQCSVAPCGVSSVEVCTETSPTQSHATNSHLRKVTDLWRRKSVRR